MKKVGVPETPLRSAPSTSSATRPGARALTQVPFEALAVEAESRGVGDEIARLQCILIGEQEIVHLPEGALRGRGFGGFGGHLGVGWTSVRGRCRQT